MIFKGDLKLRRRLYDRRFWAVQALVLLVTSFHLLLEAVEAAAGRDLGRVYVVIMYSAYFLPIVYASLNFGREGAIPTAIWAVLLAIPSILIGHRDLDRLMETVQLLTVIALAIIIAGRVDREVAARRRAEAEEAARRVSEAKYRGLFDSAGEAIVVFDRKGIIQEANVATGELFVRPVPALRGLHLGELVGAANAEKLARIAHDAEPVSGDLMLTPREGVQRWVEPVCSVVSGQAGNAVIQALFRDVTERREREHDLERYAQRILQAQEEERRRIAREIHDGSLQSLVLLCRRLDNLEVVAESELPAALRRALSDTRQSAEAIADDLRRLSRDLRPSILDDLGLAPAVKWLVNDLERRTGIRGRFATTGSEQRLSTDVELCLFRIAQEALRNVERHACASSVAVALAYEGECARLTVRDNGRGFQAKDALSKPGVSRSLGLQGIQERARLLAGDLKIVSAPGKGTRITVSIPVC